MRLLFGLRNENIVRLGVGEINDGRSRCADARLSRNPRERGAIPRAVIRASAAKIAYAAAAVPPNTRVADVVPNTYYDAGGTGHTTVRRIKRRTRNG